MEVSGGSYEASIFLRESQRQSTVAREAYFLAFAKRVRAPSVDTPPCALRAPR